MLTFMKEARKKYLKVQNKIKQILNLEYYKEPLDNLLKKVILPFLEDKIDMYDTKFNPNTIRPQNSLDRCSYEVYKEKKEEQDHIASTITSIDPSLSNHINRNDDIRYNFTLPLTQIEISLKSKIKQKFNVDKKLTISNNLGCYTKIENYNGYMGWHTNSNNPGKRWYFIYNTDDNSSFMRFINPKNEKMTTQYEPKGWSLNHFEIGNRKNPLWHCLYTKTQRFSIGITESKN